MGAPADASATGTGRWSRDLLLLTVAFAALFFFRLGSYPLGNPDEGRNAEIPREMVATGDWVTPKLDGVNYFEKPPLVYWTTGAMLKVFGPSEWSMRASPALFALAGVLLTYAAGRRLYGRATGMAAAIVLGTSLFYFILAHILVLDMAVSVLMSATLFCFILGVLEPPAPAGKSNLRRWFFYGLYASAALATLTKGLIGFLVTGAVMFLWLLVFNEWRRLRPFYLPTGVLLFLAIALPWHVLAALRNPTWFHRYIVYEHFERFLTPAASRVGPWWYFIPIVLAGLFPWVGFLWPAIRTSVTGGWAGRSANTKAWYLITWVAFIFVFFSYSKSKLPPYILPVFPALAVLIGRWLAEVPRWFRDGANPTRSDDESAHPLRNGLRVFSFVCGLLAVGLVLVVLRPALAKLSLAQAAELRPYVFAMAAVLVIGGIVVPWIAATEGTKRALFATVATLVLFFAALQCASLPEIIKPGTKALALIVRERAQPSDRVLDYHEYFHDFTFYARRLVDLVAFKGELEEEEDPAAQRSGRFMSEADFRTLWTKPGRVFVVARRRDVEGKLFADPSFHYHVLQETEDHVLFTNR
ncbi:MAG TPA: glycosyltransferase family 39 protein [Opitutaceae bacterium]|nr:glycosyltransferase family 39 protein [Opitutaceae bacterium]